MIYRKVIFKNSIKNLGISFKLIIFPNQTYDYNHTLTITFKRSFIHSDIHLFKSSSLHLLLKVSGMTSITSHCNYKMIAKSFDWLCYGKLIVIEKYLYL